jgi:hypothetical protein
MAGLADASQESVGDEIDSAMDEDVVGGNSDDVHVPVAVVCGAGSMASGASEAKVGRERVGLACSGGSECVCVGMDRAVMGRGFSDGGTDTDRTPFDGSEGGVNRGKSEETARTGLDWCVCVINC